jgi:hypothetical protein
MCHQFQFQVQNLTYIFAFLLCSPCLPVIGSFPFVPTENAQFTMQEKWLKKYGPVVGLMYGSHPVIATVGGEATLEVLRRDEFQGRPDTFNARDRAFNKRLGNTTFGFLH